MVNGSLKARPPQAISVILCTCFSLLAFAANSVLCRLALGGQQIDAAGFTVIRMLSGAVVLAAIIAVAQRRTHRSNAAQLSKGGWVAAIMLFFYAATFSFAYSLLDTATGALILFGAVQVTMLLVSLLSGQRLIGLEWAGLLMAFSGFVYLVLPGVSAPPLMGFILMSLSGMAWGFYTLKGRASLNPLSDTAYNFVRTLPFAGILALLFVNDISWTNQGLLLAVLSGAMASGVGYTVWYVALGGLTATQAAVLQLLVPIIAAVGGVVFIDEILSFRLIAASILVLGGILLVVIGKHRFSKRIAPR